MTEHLKLHSSFETHFVKPLRLDVYPFEYFFVENFYADYQNESADLWDWKQSRLCSLMGNTGHNLKIAAL